MEDLHLKIKKRAFPSHGRVRINSRLLPDLGIAEGDNVDLINEISKKTVSVSTIADTMVGAGEIRVSEDDLKSLGLKDGDDVLVRRTPPLKEKAAKAVEDTHKRLSEETKKLDTTLQKAAGDVKTSAGKTADTIKKTAGDVKVSAGKAADSIKKEAGKAGKKVKNVIDDTRGRGKDL